MSKKLIVKNETQLEANDVRIENLKDLPFKPKSCISLIQSKHDLIQQLINDREKWENTTFKTSNEQLYMLLQRCYQMYKDGCKSKESAKLLRESLDYLIHFKGIGVSKGTHSLNKIVSCVFDPNRRRSSAYSLALRVAEQDNVKPEDLPQYIRNAGGIEELRLTKTPNAMTPTQKAETAAKWLESIQLCKVKHQDLKSSDASKIGEQHVLIVTQEADGSFTVNALVSNSGVVNAALAAYYAEHKKQHDGVAAEKAVTDADGHF